MPKVMVVAGTTDGLFPYWKVTPAGPAGVAAARISVVLVANPADLA